MVRLLVAANSTWNLQNFRTGLIREFLCQGYDVLTVSPDPEGIMIGEMPVAHRRCQMGRSSINPVTDLAYAMELLRIMKEELPDVYLGFTIKPNIYGCIAARLLGIPAIPNVSGLGASFLGNSMLTKLVILMYRFAFAAAAKVFFQNPDDLDLFLRERIARPNQCRILPGSGVDLVRFTKCDLPREARFLMIARLLGDKGVREYVNAARIVRTKIADTKFTLLGELDRQNPSGVEVDELDQWINEGVLEYVGSRSDVRPFIAAASAVVLPSYREGLPRTLLEGAAMGRPLIGTDVPGCREVVRDGVTGFLCEARNASSLATVMERLARTPYETRLQMAANARTMVELEFDERFVFDAYMGEIRQI